GMLRVEGGELVAGVAEDGHRKRLEPLERPREVKDDLRAGAEHRDLGAAQLEKIRRLVFRPAAVHATDATRGHKTNPGPRRDPHRGGDRGGPRGAMGKRRAKVA